MSLGWARTARIAATALTLSTASNTTAEEPKPASFLDKLAQLGEDVADTLVFSLPEGRPLPTGGHLQGVQRLGRDRWLLSGSSADFAYLIQADTDAQASTLVRLTPSPLRHAGGIQLMDRRFLIVGLEDNHTRDHSKIQVFDLGTPPTLVGLSKTRLSIEREGPVKVTTAGAVALAETDNQIHLVVGTWDSATLDFYTTGTTATSARIDNRNWEKFTWSAEGARRDDWSDASYGSYQNLHWHTEANGTPCLIGFCRDEGQDCLDVFELSLDKQTPIEQRLRKVVRKRFNCEKTTFQAGGGLEIDQDGNITVFACANREGVIEVFR